MIGVVIRTCACVALLSLLASTAIGQQTWIVAPYGGGNFTSLAQAVAAASPGDVLLLVGSGVGSTNFGSCQVDKTLTLAPQGPGVAIINQLTVVQGALPDQLVSVNCLVVSNADLRAPVVFDQVSMFGCVTSAPRASFHDCSFHFAPYGSSLHIASGDVVMTSCGVSGGGWRITNGMGSCQVSGGSPTVTMSGGSLAMNECDVSGGSATYVLCASPGYYLPPMPAIFGSGTVRATNCTLTGGNGYGPFASVAPVVLTQGTFEYDASCTFAPINPVGTQVFLPGTGGHSTWAGGTIVCHVDTGPNLPAALVASLGFQSPTAVPQGIAWIDPNAMVVLVIGFTDASGSLQSVIPVPTWAPRGLPITVQGVAASSASGTLVAAVPAVFQVL